MTIPASSSTLTGHAAPGITDTIAGGILFQRFDVSQCNTSRTLATQAVLGIRVPVMAGTTLSGVAVCIETAASGTTPTAVYVALFSVAGVQLAVSADVKAIGNWNATGIFSFAFATAYAPTADAAVIPAILKNGVYGSTEPKIACMTAVVGSGQALGANSPGAVTQTGQATMPSPATLVANDSYPWLALV